MTTAADTMTRQGRERERMGRETVPEVDTGVRAECVRV